MPPPMDTSAMSVTVNLKGLEKQISNLKRLPMNNIALKALELNFDQIQKKKNKDGSNFKPYSVRYAEKKGVGRNDVDLTSKASALSPSQKKKPYATMLKSYKVVSVGRFRATIGFTAVWDRQKAAWVVGGGKYPNKARPFVGLTKKNRQKLNKFAYTIISKGTY